MNSFFIKNLFRSRSVAGGVVFFVIFSIILFSHGSKDVHAQATCVRAAPTIVATPSTQAGYPGKQKIYIVRVSNQDSAACAASDFSFSLPFPGFSAFISIASPTSIAAGSYKDISVYVTALSNAPVGTSTASFQADDASVSEHTASIPLQFVVRALPVYAPGEQRTAVFLVNFFDDKSQPFTPASMYQTFFSNTGTSVNTYNKEQSYNGIFFSGDVYGWYTSSSSVAVRCNHTAETPAAEIETYARAHGVPVDDYSRKVYIFVGGACSYAGYAYFGVVNQSPVNPTTAYIVQITNRVIFHELGHNFGLSHAHSYACSNGQYVYPVTGCTYTEYGDNSSMMGSGQVAQFNAPQRSYLGWLPSQTVTTDGTYTLTYSESATGLRLLKIPGPKNGGFHFVSYRKAVGFDAAIPSIYLGGAMVHTGSDFEQSLFSLTGTTNSQWALADGMTFTDLANRITVKQISHTADTATVSISFSTSTCASSPPNVVISPASSTGVAGSAIINTVTVYNTDAPECNTAFFTPQTILPSGWSGTFNPATLTILPGRNASFQYTVTSPSSAAANTYSIAARVSDYINPAHVKTASSTYTINSAACTRATPTLTATPASRTFNPGTATTYSLRLTQKDMGCAPSSYTLTPTLVSGWTVTINPSTAVSLNAFNAYADFTLSVTSSTFAPSATTTIQIAVSDPITALHATSSSVAYGVLPVATVCSNLPPTVTLTPNIATGAGGTMKQYTMRVTNRDTAACAPSTFDVAASAPSGWNTNFSSSSLMLSPNGVFKDTVLSVTPPVSVVSGTTTVPITITDTLAASHTVNTSVAYLIPFVCIRQTPVISLSPSNQTVVAGSNVSYTVAITNRDNATCASSTFELSPTMPSGWPGSISPTSVSVSPGLFGSAILNVSSLVDALAGSYPVGINLIDTATPSHNTSGSGAYTISGGTGTPLPDTSAMSISASRVRTGHASTLTWWVSSGLTTGVTCSVGPSSKIQSGNAPSFDGNDTATNWGSAANPVTTQTVPITMPTIFTLTCSNGTSAPAVKSAIVKLIPMVNEI